MGLKQILQRGRWGFFGRADAEQTGPESWLGAVSFSPSGRAQTQPGNLVLTQKELKAEATALFFVSLTFHNAQIRLQAVFSQL